MSKWISAEEQRPKVKETHVPINKSEEVLFTNGEEYFIGYCNTSCGDEDATSPRWYNRDNRILISDVTCWTSLPDLPERA